MLAVLGGADICCIIFQTRFPKMKSYIPLTVVFFISLFQSVCCVIQCHQCANKDNPNCIDPYDGAVMADSYLGDCEFRDTHCTKFKTVQHLYDSGFILGSPRVSYTTTRGCTRADQGFDTSNFGTDGCGVITTSAGYMQICICSESGCNSASTLIASILLLLLSAFGVYCLKKII